VPHDGWPLPAKLKSLEQWLGGEYYCIEVNDNKLNAMNNHLAQNQGHRLFPALL
jgi:hypothetical protein